MPSDAKHCPSCKRTFDRDVLYCSFDGAPLVPKAPVTTKGSGSESVDPYIGIRIFEQFEIQKLIGIGSMARVYRAFQHGMGRDVAVKILHRELSSNAEIRQRFHQEARIASCLFHPHVVQVLLTAQLPASHAQPGEELVLILEYLDGMSLLSALEASGSALSLQRAIHILLQICDAVGEAHSKGIVHRDIKPENVMLLTRGDDSDYVKVLDFGLARIASKDASHATREGAICGTPRYLSPEGAQGLPVGPAADVYALATLLYQCLAGRTPFECDSPVGFLLAHANETPAPITTHERASYVPKPLADLLERNLSKHPEDREPDAHAFGRALLEASQRSGLLTESRVSSTAARGTIPAPLEDLPRFASLSRGGYPHQPSPIEHRLRSNTDPYPLSPPEPQQQITQLKEAPHGDSLIPSGTLLSPSPLPLTPVSAAAIRYGPITPAVPYGAPPQQDARPGGASLPVGVTIAERRHPNPLFTLLLIVVCFAAGAALAAAGAARLGFFTASPSHLSRADALLAEAADAEAHEAWDNPPISNVRDLLARGRIEFPDDLRFKETAHHASVSVMLHSVQERQTGHTAEALHFAKLALEFEPSNSAAATAVQELGFSSSAPAPSIPLLSSQSHRSGTPAPYARIAPLPSAALYPSSLRPPSFKAAPTATPSLGASAPGAGPWL